MKARVAMTAERPDTILAHRVLVAYIVAVVVDNV
jgi:hypothetical protein